MITLSVALVVLVLVARAAAWARRRSRWHRVLLVQTRPAVRTAAVRAVRAAVRVPLRGPASAVMIGAALGAIVGSVLSGPVAAAVLAGYGAAGFVLLRRRHVRRTEAVSRRTASDAVAALAAELRVGRQVASALAAAGGALTGPAVLGADAASIARRVEAAVAVAQSSGAPLADVLDRLDSHLRAIERTRATAGAQAAGARVSALLLASMPVAGAGLGVAIGVDPLPVLLRSRLGAACLLGAVALQLGGLAWAARLSRIEVPA